MNLRTDEEKELMNVMYGGTTTLEQFNWDRMHTVPILSLMSMQDIDYIRKLILSPRYSGNNKYKMDKIDEVMHFRGFTRFAGGTNRLVYIHPAAPNAVFKVAIDSVGITDNPAEYHNQDLLKPYCCKVFECSPCGTIASFERVYRITTFDEFYQIADDYFYILSRKIIGKYVMEDIGIDFFMNVGIRVGCHPVILDFPYLYELDGRKLKCGNELDDGTICGGEIDYDDGFNKLICKKCGRIYRAKDLAKPPETSRIFVVNENEEEYKDMTTRLYRGNRIVRLMEDNKIIFDEKMMHITYDQWKAQQKQVEEAAKQVQPSFDEISYSAPVPTVSAHEAEPKKVEAVSEVAEAPKQVESDQLEEMNFDKVKQIIHENTTPEDPIVEKIPNEIELASDEEAEPENIQEEDNQHFKVVEATPEQMAPDSPSEPEEEDEEENIPYEIVKELPPRKEMEEDVLYFVVNDSTSFDMVKSAYEGVKDPSIINTVVCTPYALHEGNVCHASYDRENDQWIIEANNPIAEQEQEKKVEQSVEVKEEDTKTYTPNPMMELLKNKSNVKINLEDLDE